MKNCANVALVKIEKRNSFWLFLESFKGLSAFLSKNKTIMQYFGVVKIRLLITIFKFYFVYITKLF